MSKPKKSSQKQPHSPEDVDGIRASGPFFTSDAVQGLLLVSLTYYCFRVLALGVHIFVISWHGLKAALLQATSVLADVCGALFLSITKKTTTLFDVCVRVIELIVTVIMYAGYCLRALFCIFPHRLIRNYRNAHYRRAPEKKLLTLSVDVSLLHKKQRAARLAAKRLEEILEPQIVPFERFELPAAWHRRMSSFVLVCLLFLVPFVVVHASGILLQKKNVVTDRVSSGITAIEQGTDLLQAEDFAQATDIFQKSLSDFGQARDTLGTINDQLISLARFIPGRGSSLDDGVRVIAAGRDLAQAGLIFSGAAQPLKTQMSSASPFATLVSSTRILDEALPLLQDAKMQLDAVHESSLPPDIRDSFKKGKESVAKIISSANDATALSHALLRILGSDEKKRYLVIFQNDGELRATGGFIGSFALIDVAHGALTHIEIPGGGPYDLQGSLSAHVIAPLGLHLIRTGWQFQDANWFPDFPTSAKKLMWFYEKSGGPTVDGVFAMNASLVTSLLGITGPISMPAYNKTITQENFLMETQKAVEVEYDKKENKPKKFIGDLFPLLLERLLATKEQDVPKLSKTLVGAALSREIQFYAQDSGVQRVLSGYGVTGEYPIGTGDTLLVVNSNVGGGKSDAVIHRSLERSITVDENGALHETLKLHIEHPGPVKDPLYGMLNVDFVRFYVPKGSILLHADGFEQPDPTRYKVVPPRYREDTDLNTIEQFQTQDPLTGMYIHQENGYTVFSQWIQTRPESVHTVTLTYALPFSVRKDMSGASYQLPVSLLRQSGSNIEKVTTTITPARGTVQEIGSPASLPTAIYKKSEDFLHDVHTLILFKHF